MGTSSHSYGYVTCHMGSHSVTVTCHPTQVNAPRCSKNVVKMQPKVKCFIMHDIQA